MDQRSVEGVFLGYNSNNKGYRVFDVRAPMVIVATDVKFDEARGWNWEKGMAESCSKNSDQANIPQEQEVTISEKESSDISDYDSERAVRGTRSLSDVYARCNVVLIEPSCFKEVASSQGWFDAMKEELMMIEKNSTWQLVDRPKNRNVIGVKWVF